VSFHAAGVARIASDTGIRVEPSAARELIIMKPDSASIAA
jgi:hypothetical protein